LFQCLIKSAVYADLWKAIFRENIPVMNIKLASITVAVLTISACSTPVNNPAPTGADVAVAEASYSVSRSIVSLSEVAQASRPLPVLDAPPNPVSYGMAEPVSVDWTGPVESLLKQLAIACNYRLRILGYQPAIPVLVTVSAKNEMVADVIRDVGYQCGRRANVVIFPESRVIELRYAKN
jgi:defect in organelle trafficking protein DotD